MFFLSPPQTGNFPQWSMPFGGFGPCGPSTGVPQFAFPQSPSLNGASSLTSANLYWSQLMQAQQSLLQGWQQFCGPSQGPPKCQGQPPQVHHHFHYHFHPAAQESPRPAPAPQPTPQPTPRPIPVTPQRPVTSATTHTVTIPSRPSLPNRPSQPTRPLPNPPSQVPPAILTPPTQVAPALPRPPSFPSFGTVTGPSGSWGTTPTRPEWNLPPSSGQSIEDIFNNPFAGQEYLKEALDTISAVRAVYGVQPSRTVGQKGDLRVIAGDRSDGVKPREVRIDDANSYDWQKGENSYQENRTEVRFKDGTIGREYDITVTWEDGTATRKRVQLREAGQIVYIRTAEGY